MVTVKVDTSDIRRQILSKFGDMDNYVQRISADRKIAIANEFVHRVTPLIPKKNEYLRKSVQVGVGRTIYVTWEVYNGKFEYAERQFTHQYDHYTTPGTGPHWDERFMNDGRRWSAFLKACEKILRR